jgi:4-hydroxy-tetrahydrodipicolinate synthase
MKAMLPVMTVLERGGKFAQCVKYGCELDGLPAGTVRLPLRPMKKELKRELRDAIKTARTTIRSIVNSSQQQST